MAKKILGRATIKFDGRTVLSKKGSTLDPGGVARTPVVGSRSVHGFTEELTACSLDVKITQTDEIALEEIRAIEDATIVFEGDDGVSYVITGAFSTTTPKLAETEGEISATFSGTSCDRV
ncbi:phage tail tube protein [Nevskia sp.]|jgi:hypothetical protein|uniref:phage tail tube protein n=1 Tax=Nevskia sp. TaxID=1929292 RepID=UPI0025ECB8B3|nr:phage tail tube protein [Nevskia sp.]